MHERKAAVTFKGQPMTLLGPELKEGDRAPNCRLVDPGMAVVELDHVPGKVKIISAVPSLDTSVCSLETRRFDQEIAALPEVRMATISMDLPFAQKRWAAEACIKHVHLLSDYRFREFGRNWGVLIKELDLLARTLFVVDQDRHIRYIQRVPEITHEPDYAAVLEAARGLMAAV
jgi:thiol peroxidase